MKKAEVGVSPEELVLQHGLSKLCSTSGKQNKYSGMSASKLKRLKELEEENHRLKQMYANLSFEHEALKDIIKKTQKPKERPELVKYAIAERKLSERQAYRAVNCLIRG